VTPKEAARRLIRVGPPVYDTICLACHTPIETFDGGELPHAPDCPWLQMPKILAALEAAEQVVSRAFHPARDGMQPGYADAIKALVAALKGES
jgi:mono/diheme cytochrome c family protein